MWRNVRIVKHGQSERKCPECKSRLTSEVDPRGGLWTWLRRRRYMRCYACGCEWLED